MTIPEPETEAPRATTVVHLVPHTHWDREWYEPFQVFRMRLVELVDQLLEQMDRDPTFAFTLDGQLATVDDYLEIRPHEEARIRALVESGRLAIGPWQILMDEFLVSGETLVRNLEAGWRRADQLGGPMRVGYLPDMFGHVAQMPQILRRAGLSDAVLWRGVPAAIDRHAFRWYGPDGSEVRTEYLVGGYGQAAYLFAIPDRLERRLGAYHELMRPFYGDASLLAMYGTDHAIPAADLSRLVEGLNASQDRYEVRVETLARYVAGRGAAEGPGGNGGLPEWTGEMRSGARANVLMGVASARVDLKQAAGRAEQALERYAEPLQALYGGPWPSSLLELAWRRVVDNSAHDSICGCSVDPVVAQVIGRFAEAEQVGRGLAVRAVANVAALQPRGSWAIVNPSPVARDGLVEVYAPVPDAWDRVALELPSGARVTTQEVDRNHPLLWVGELRGAELPTFLARRLHGRELFGRSLNDLRMERLGDGPQLSLFVDDVPDPPWLDIDELRTQVEAAVAAAPEERWRVRIEETPRRRLVASVPVPALGWTGVRVVEGDGALERPVHVVDGRLLDNGLVRVGVEEDGTITLERDRVRVEHVGRIVDGGDHGDSYNYGPPRDDELVGAPTDVRVRVEASGPVRGTITVSRTYSWPAATRPDGSGRSAETIPTTVETSVELRAGEPFVRVSVAFENRSRDHRVRFHVPLPRVAERSSAEGQFAVVERGLTVEAGHGEVPLPTFPAHGWVDAGGMAVLLEHILEYELVDEGREVALTLLRAFGLISRNENPYRDDPAGPERPVPDGQCLRPWRVSFALLPHAGEWWEADVVGAAERYRHELLIDRGGPVSGSGAGGTVEGGRPSPHAIHVPLDDEVPAVAPSATGPVTASPPLLRSREGLAIDGAGVVLSSLRRRDDWLEVRVVAEHPEATTAVIRHVAQAREVDLLGRPLAELPVADAVLTLPMRPWEIRTIQIRRR